MSTAHDDVLKSALALPESDRIQLAAELLDSIQGTPTVIALDDPGFEEELDKRFNDGTRSVPWAKVSQQLEADLNK